MDAARARAQHQALPLQERYRAPPLTRTAIEALVSTIHSIEDEKALGIQKTLLALLTAAKLWKHAMQHMGQLGVKGTDLQTLKDFREWHARQLGQITSPERRTGRARNIWIKLQAKVKAPSPHTARSTPTPRRTVAPTDAVPANEQWTLGTAARVLGSGPPLNLPRAPSYEGPIPTYSGRAVTDSGTMAPVTLPSSPYEHDLATWWASKAAEHHATPLTIQILKARGSPVVTSIADKLRACSGVAFTDSEELRRLEKKDGAPTMYTNHMPVVTASHPQRWILLRLCDDGVVRAYTYGVQLLASLLEVPPGDELRKGLTQVPESEAMAMVGNGVNARDCARVIEYAATLIPEINEMREITIADMACGYGSALACFMRAFPTRCKIRFAADLARSCGVALTTSFGDVLENFYPDAHSEESQRAMARLGRVDFLFMGFPCPPLSRANRVGTEDRRRQQAIEDLMALEYAALAYVQEARPRCVILETTDGVRQSADMRAVWMRMETVVRARSPGYKWVYTRTKALHAGTLNARDRVWMIGHSAPESHD